MKPVNRKHRWYYAIVNVIATAWIALVLCALFSLIYVTAVLVLQS
jgi:ABC-type multidrug transport system permease subunit